MRYIEYIYLAIAIILVFFMATEYKHLSTTNLVGIFAGIAIASFMYSFRRNQRIKFEQLDREEAEAALKQEAEEDGN